MESTRESKTQYQYTDKDNYQEKEDEDGKRKKQITIKITGCSLMILKRKKKTRFLIESQKILLEKKIKKIN